jgi:glutathione S-transferase
MTSLPLAALVTLFVIVLMIYTSINVGRARGRYGVKSPAMSGHEMFERAFRVQMNTLESAAVMLPALWLYAGFIDDRGAGAMGAIWLAARIWYVMAYMADPANRGKAFGLSFFTVIGLWLGALWGVGKVLLH